MGEKRWSSKSKSEEDSGQGDRTEEEDHGETKRLSKSKRRSKRASLSIGAEPGVEEHSKERRRQRQKKYRRGVSATSVQTLLHLVLLCLDGTQRGLAATQTEYKALFLSLLTFCNVSIGVLYSMLLRPPGVDVQLEAERFTFLTVSPYGRIQFWMLIIVFQTLLIQLFAPVSFVGVNSGLCFLMCMTSAALLLPWPVEGLEWSTKKQWDVFAHRHKFLNKRAVLGSLPLWLLAYPNSPFRENYFVFLLAFCAVPGISQLLLGLDINPYIAIRMDSFAKMKDGSVETLVLSILFTILTLYIDFKAFVIMRSYQGTTKFEALTITIVYYLQVIGYALLAASILIGLTVIVGILSGLITDYEINVSGFSISSMSNQTHHQQQQQQRQQQQQQQQQQQELGAFFREFFTELVNEINNARNEANQSSNESPRLLDDEY